MGFFHFSTDIPVTPKDFPCHLIPQWQPYVQLAGRLLRKGCPMAWRPRRRRKRRSQSLAMQPNELRWSGQPIDTHQPLGVVSPWDRTWISHSAFERLFLGNFGLQKIPATFGCFHQASWGKQITGWAALDSSLHIYPNRVQRASQTEFKELPIQVSSSAKIFKYQWSRLFPYILIKHETS